MVGRVLVTGASGFVGQALCAELLLRGHLIRATVRSASSSPQALANGRDAFVVEDIGPETNWPDALADIDCIVHCAARAHVMRETEVDVLAAYRGVNLAGTQRLAAQASTLGVRRLIYISSIKVNGEHTLLGQPFTAQDIPHPQTPYSVSKAEAEIQLRHIAETTGLEVVIIRPPLVYGPSVKANFLSIMQWLDKSYPLPLGAIHNLRSLVALPNLVDLIIHCITHPAAANQTFLVSDNEDLSTTDLLRRLSQALDKPARLLPVPISLLQAAAQVIGKPALTQRLCGSLQVDISKTQSLLGWEPPVTVDHGLKMTAQHFQQSQKR